MCCFIIITDYGRRAEQKKIQFDKWLLSRSVNATIAENALAEASSATVPSRSSSIVISLPHARDMCDSDMDSDDESESSDRSEKRISSEALERCDINERILKPSEMLSQSIAESSELSRVTELEVQCKIFFSLLHVVSQTLKRSQQQAPLRPLFPHEKSHSLIRYRYPKF